MGPGPNRGSAGIWGRVAPRKRLRSNPAARRRRKFRPSLLVAVTACDCLEVNRITSSRRPWRRRRRPGRRAWTDGPSRSATGAARPFTSHKNQSVNPRQADPRRSLMVRTEDAGGSLIDENATVTSRSAVERRITTNTSTRAGPGTPPEVIEPMGVPGIAGLHRLIIVASETARPQHVGVPVLEKRDAAFLTCRCMRHDLGCYCVTASRTFSVSRILKSVSIRGLPSLESAR